MNTSEDIRKVSKILNILCSVSKKDALKMLSECDAYVKNNQLFDNAPLKEPIFNT